MTTAITLAALDTAAPLPTLPPPATCVCILYHTNKDIYGIGECPHTTGQRDPRFAVPFDRKAFAAGIKAEIAAEKAGQP